MSYNIGAIFGYIGLGFLADQFGRKPVVMIFFAASLVLTPVLYRGRPICISCCWSRRSTASSRSGKYSWMSVWLPELFPTRMRATGMAFTFNARASSRSSGRCSPAC